MSKIPQSEIGEIVEDEVMLQVKVPESLRDFIKIEATKSKQEMGAWLTGLFLIATEYDPNEIFRQRKV